MAVSNPHEGHRARLKKRFLEEGIDSFQDHEVIELLLFYGVPYRDTNELAHRLVEAFGSISGIMDAPYDELRAVSGVGENTAVLLKLIPELSRRYSVSRSTDDRIVNSSADAGRYLLPHFLGRTSELVLLLCLDAKGKVLGLERISQGSANAAVLDVRKIVSAAIKYGASAVVLAHNHNSGVAVPSREDLLATWKVRSALEGIDVVLLDHIIAAEGDFVSMADSKLLDEDSDAAQKTTPPGESR